MTTKIGMEGKLMHNSASFGTPTWAECKAVKDVSLEIQVNKVDASRRGGQGWRQSETTLKDGTLTVLFIKDKSDATFVAIESAYRANTAMELAVLDGANAIGTDWFTAMWKVESWGEDQALEEVIANAVTLSIAPDPASLLFPTYGTGALPVTRP